MQKVEKNYLHNRPHSWPIFSNYYTLGLVKMSNLKRYTFVKKTRLKKNKDFKNVYDEGKVYVDRYSVLYVLPKEELLLKVGFAVGKKLGNAVLRNSIKRKMREVLRHIQHNIRPGYQLVWVARKPLVNKKLDMYYQVFERVLIKMQLYCREG